MQHAIGPCALQDFKGFRTLKYALHKHCDRTIVQNLLMMWWPRLTQTPTTGVAGSATAWTGIARTFAGAPFLSVVGATPWSPHSPTGPRSIRDVVSSSKRHHFCVSSLFTCATAGHHAIAYHVQD